MTTWNIKKTDEDRYHVSSRDLIDEEGDGSQLMGIQATHWSCNGEKGSTRVGD
jgi:hypothetical protein